MPRDLEKDKDRLGVLWERDYIEDIQEVMIIADYAVHAALNAESENDRLRNEMDILQEQLSRRWKTS
jgi:hypothetical protein